MTGLAVLLSCFIPASTATAAPLPVVAGRVTRVIDADTIDVQIASGRIRVRLQGIDAPERDQPGGREASRWLQARLTGRQVWLEPVSQDRYDRMVAIVHRDRTNMNRELVRQGQAWAYRHYLRKADRGLCGIEYEARQSRRGLWRAQGVSAHAPWQFRATHGRGPFTDYSRGGTNDCLREMRHSRS